LYWLCVALLIKPSIRPMYIRATDWTPAYPPRSCYASLYCVYKVRASSLLTLIAAVVGESLRNLSRIYSPLLHKPRILLFNSQLGIFITTLYRPSKSTQSWERRLSILELVTLAEDSLVNCKFSLAGSPRVPNHFEKNKY
jgi:hypothetical protein